MLSLFFPLKSLVAIDIAQRSPSNCGMDNPKNLYIILNVTIKIK